MSNENPFVCYVVGLMSGTSMDGIDAALVKVSQLEQDIELKLVQFSTFPFSNGLKEKLLKLSDPEIARIEDISMMNIFLGEVFADVSVSIVKEAGLTPTDILLISSHGQTIFHQPTPTSMFGKEVTSTLQIGDIGVIAERTGITTVGDFRTRDMAAGGQGAPLVPYADFLLFQEKEFGRVMVNIGGISNITVLSKNCNKSEVIAYDTGPGNMIIDAFTSWTTQGDSLYDEDGSLAAQGKVHQKWLKQLLQLPYFSLSPPKSTGREMFGLSFAKKLWDEAETKEINHVDKIATVTELTAKTISLEISKYIELCNVKEVLVSGGGRFNKTLMKQIGFYLPKDVFVKGTEEFGIPAEAKEAIAFALLGYQCYQRRANNLPSATGAKNNVVLGKIAW